MIFDENFLLHLVISLFLGLILGVIRIRLIMAISIVFFLGLGKELYDLYRVSAYPEDLPSVLEPLFDIVTNILFAFIGYFLSLFLREREVGKQFSSSKSKFMTPKRVLFNKERRKRGL